MATENATPSAAAKKAAKAVMTELKDRRGIRQAIDDCDSDVIKELTTTLAQIIDKQMGAAK